MRTRTKKICLVSSHGGHFKELSNAVKGLEGDIFWVTARTSNTQHQLENKKHHFVIDPVASKAKFVLNFFQSLLIILAERPTHVVSTGAGIALFCILLAKYLAGAKVIYIESAANVVHPSRTGKFIYPRADLFLVQWEQNLTFYPKAQFVGLL